MRKLLSVLLLLGSLRVGSVFAIELNAGNIGTYCSRGAKECYLSGKNITSIATNTFLNYSQLNILDLKGNAITSISSGVFKGLSNLTWLTLSRNQISTIEPGSFEPLSKLTELYLYSNPLTNLEAGVFSGLNSLQFLDLHSSIMSEINSGVWDGLINLSKLDLSANIISNIELLHLSGLDNLVQIDLQKNNITKIDVITDFSGLPKLENINLESNKIDAIPTGFSLLPKLNTLVLSNNLITGLNEETFIELTGLTTLVLDDNKIAYIESGSFLPLKMLEGLWLNNNPITGIYIGTFNGLENLTDIYLGGTPIRYIEDGSFSGLEKLHTLDLYRVSGGCLDNITSRTFEGPTQLGYLSFCARNIETGALSGKVVKGVHLFIVGDNTYGTGLNLTSGALEGVDAGTLSLDFYYCPNCSIAEDAFSKMTNTIYLNIAGYAKIGSGVITPKLFNHLYNLKTLRVQGIYTGITLGSFSNLDKLNQLELGGQIEDIESQTFQGLNNLTELDLRSNNISSIKSGTFNQMPLLTAIHLGRNRIKEIELGAFSGIQKKLAVLFVNNNNISLDGDMVNYLNSVANTVYSDSQHSYITYTPDENTSGPVVATVHLINGDLITNNGAKNTYTFTKNGTFDFKIEQTNGYRGYHRATVTWINSPLLQTTPTLSYSTTLPTTGDVTATISFSSGGTVTNNGGANTHLFTSNGTFTFDFTDLAGHTGSILATVSNIDKINPIGNISFITNENGTVSARLTLSETGIILNTSGVTTVTPGFVFEHIFTEIGNFTFNFADLVGNTGTKTVTINSMSSTPGDTTPPTGIISYTTNPNGSVTATITLSEVGSIVNNGGSNQYTFTSNGSFIFQFNDLAGNNGYATATVIGIISTPAPMDTTSPIGTITIRPSGNFYDSIYYISGYRPTLSIVGNTGFGFQIMGDLTTNSIGSYTTGVLNQSLVLDPGEGIKNIQIDYTNTNDYSRGGLDPITFYVDTTKPEIITTYPIPLLTTTGSSMTFEWIASDTGAGISGYVLELTKLNRRPTLIYLGPEDTNYTITKLSNGTYTWKIRAIDYAGNTTETTAISFTLGSTALLGDTSPDSFSLDRVYDADLDEQYKSEVVTVSGLSTGTKVLASVDTGSLLINSGTVGTTGYVQNGDKVQIVLYSSKKYNTLTSGTLTIGDQSSSFKIVSVSKGNDTGNYKVSSLSTSEKLNLSLVYNALLGIYNEDEQDDFMLSFKYIVKDKIEKMVDNDEDERKIDKMKYLYNVINKNFKGDEDLDIIDEVGNDEKKNPIFDDEIQYTAPNGKKYTITYDNKGYTSSNFLKKGKYFDSLTEVKAFINKNNPKSPYHMIDFTIDTTWNQSYVAPNGKKYILFKTTDGRYGSNSFIYGKIFTSLNTIQSYINQNNHK